jgi:hypothetical protein
MLPVNSTKVEDRYFVVGAACAVIAGCLVAFIDGFGGVPGVLLSEPRVVALGLTVAAIGGGLLARRIVDAPLVRALFIALLLGVAVPIVTGAIVVLPFAPFGAVAGREMWPVTVPAGLMWMIAVRSLARRPAPPRQSIRVGIAFSLALVLLLIRYTQPAWVNSSDGTRCLSFPGEEIGSIAWSPDGLWLGIGSSRDFNLGIIRVLERSTGRIFDLAAGTGIDTNLAGVAVGPGGMTAYLDAPIEPGGEPGRPTPIHASIVVVSPDSPPRRYAELPGPAIADLTYTEDGIATVVWLDPETGEVDVDRPVWIEEGSTPQDRLREITPDEAIRQPVLAPLMRRQAESMTIRTPSSKREIPRPVVDGTFSVTGDGREVLFVVTDPNSEERRDEVVAMSTVTGRRQILATTETADDPQIAGGWLAYRTAVVEAKSACLKPAELVD